MFIISAEFEPLKYFSREVQTLPLIKRKVWWLHCVCNFSGLHDTYATFFDIVSACVNMLIFITYV